MSKTAAQLTKSIAKGYQVTFSSFKYLPSNIEDITVETHSTPGMCEGGIAHVSDITVIKANTLRSFGLDESFANAVEISRLKIEEVIDRGKKRR